MRHLPPVYRSLLIGLAAAAIMLLYAIALVALWWLGTPYFLAGLLLAAAISYYIYTRTRRNTPLNRAATSSRPLVEQLSDVPPCTLNVVVVDDDSTILTSLKQIVGQRGHNVQCFQHPQHVLARLTDNIDVVFSDKSMPGLDGLELLEHIQSRLPDATLALVTGHIDDNDRVRANAMGIHIILKPFSALSIHHVLQVGMAAKQQR